MEKKVINLNAFGEILIPKEKLGSTFGDTNDEYYRSEERPFRRTKEESNVNPHETVFKNILENIVQAKLLHWQTYKYSQHKALDELFDSLIDLGDELAESIMGKYGRPHLSEENLCLQLFNYDGDLSRFMDNLYSCYRNDCRCLFDENKDSELLNIIDEIISLIDKIKYLLTLE
jgi:DNA-binding ferritin-like protein